MTKLKTADLYYGAYLLSKGDRLEKIEKETYGKRRVFFEFTGNDLRRHALEYVNGTALVNLKDLKASLNRLRDIIHEDAGQLTC